MKYGCVVFGAGLLLLAAGCSPEPKTTQAATAAPLANSGDPGRDLAALQSAISAKIAAGENTEADLAPELKQFDVLLAADPGEKSDAMAKIAFARAKLYATSLHQPEKALPMYRQIQADYPGTATAQDMTEAIPALEKKIETFAIRNSLAIGTKFPDFSVTDLEGKPLALADYRGKVVLIEFWAAWCSDCMMQMPSILAIYHQYHAKGFDVIGISLDREDKRVLTNYLTENKIPWPQFYDGKYFDNALAVKYGVHYTPENYLLDREGVIIGKDLQRAALESAVAKALAGGAN